MGTELWKSNGTAAGTVEIAEILVEGNPAFLYNMTDVAGTLYFLADNLLYTSDGTGRVPSR